MKNVFDTSRKFLGEFVTKPTVIGAVTPSSGFLAETIIAGLQLRSASAVAEYGPGTGIFTEYILKEIHPAAKFFAVEINPNLVQIFKARHPKVPIFEDSVENIGKICAGQGIRKLDAIVSGLPWTAFSEEMQITYLNEMMTVLRPGGHFVTFAYIHAPLLPPGQRFARLLPKYFKTVKKSRVVWLNLPPAFVYRCVR